MAAWVSDAHVLVEPNMTGKAMFGGLKVLQPKGTSRMAL